MRVAVLLALICLSACGNVNRPLPYTLSGDPIWQLQPMPEGGGNAFSTPPVPGAGRIKSGL